MIVYSKSAVWFLAILNASIAVSFISNLLHPCESIVEVATATMVKADETVIQYVPSSPVLSRSQLKVHQGVQ